MDYLDRSFNILVTIVDMKKYLREELGFENRNGSLYVKESEDQPTYYVKFGDTNVEFWTSKDFYKRETTNYSLVYDMIKDGTETVTGFIDKNLLKVKPIF